jgi:Skp family chaperone for outer membrane proteins
MKLKIFFLLFLFYLQNSQAQQKIAYCDSKILFENMPETLQIQQYLAVYQKEYEQKLKNEEKKAEKKYEEIMSDLQKRDYSAKEVEKRETEIFALQSALKDSALAFEQKIKEIETARKTVIWEKLKKTILVVAKEEGYDYVLNINILYDDKANAKIITEKIAKKLGFELP